MPPRPVRIGGRASPLGRWQADHIRSALADAGVAARTVSVPAAGRPAAARLIEPLLAGRVDVAVHSLELLPLGLPAGVEIAAIVGRDDPRDVLVGREPVDWFELPFGATIGAAGERRRAQLLAARPDLRVVGLAGDVTDRLAWLDATPPVAAIVLAGADLIRLGLDHRISDRLDPMLVLPAPGQGALAVTVRAGEPELRAVVRAAVHDPETAVAVAAERAFLGAFGGTPSAPVAAHATRDPPTGRLRLHGRVVAADGAAVAEAMRLAAVREGDEPAAERLGRALAAQVRARGADAILHL